MRRKIFILPCPSPHIRETLKMDVGGFICISSGWKLEKFLLPGSPLFSSWLDSSVEKLIFHKGYAILEIWKCNTFWTYKQTFALYLISLVLLGLSFLITIVILLIKSKKSYKQVMPAKLHELEIPLWCSEIHKRFLEMWRLSHNTIIYFPFPELCSRKANYRQGKQQYKVHH